MKDSLVESGTKAIANAAFEDWRTSASFANTLIKIEMEWKLSLIVSHLRD